MATASKRTARNELLDVKKRNRSQSNDDNLIEKLDKGGRRLGGMHPIFLQLIVLKDSQCHMSERKPTIGSGPKKCPQRVKGPGTILHPKLDKFPCTSCSPALKSGFKAICVSQLYMTAEIV